MEDVYLQRLTENSRLPEESKQTQFKPNSKPNKPNNESKIKGAKPIQTQSNPILELLNINAFARETSFATNYFGILAGFITLKGVKKSSDTYDSRAVSWSYRNNPDDIPQQARTYLPS